MPDGDDYQKMVTYNQEQKSSSGEKMVSLQM